MSFKKTFVITSLALLSGSSEGRVLSRAELAQTIRDLATVNAVIERESDIVRQRCVNQGARDTNIRETLASLNSQSATLNTQLQTAIADRAPHLTALNNAKTFIATKASEIRDLELRIANLGRNSARESELLDEKTAKVREKGSKEQQQRALRNGFDQWESEGNNGRILDAALAKLAQNPNAQLTLNERNAVAREADFNLRDNALSEAIQTLSVRIDAINTELDNINTVDNRTLAELRGTKTAAELAKSNAEAVERTEKPQVVRFNERIRALRAQIAGLTGFRAAEPINPDCALIRQTQ